MKLFLDDIRDPSWVYGLGADKDWSVVRSYSEFTAWIAEHGLPDVVSFDHDLGGIDEDGNEVDPAQVPTGMDCAHALVEYCLDNGVRLPQFEVHSANVAGAANIRGLLLGFRDHQDREGLTAIAAISSVQMSNKGPHRI